MSDALQEQLEQARAARAHLSEHERLQALAGQVEALEVLQEQEARRLQGQAMIVDAFTNVRATIDAAKPALRDWRERYAKACEELEQLIAEAPTVQAPLLQAANDLKRAAREAAALGVLTNEREIWARAGGTSDDLAMIAPARGKPEFGRVLAEWIIQEKRKLRSTRAFELWRGGNWSLSQFFR